MVKDNQAHRVLKIIGWAGNRYARNGNIVTNVGGVPTRFKVIEDLAFMKYLGVSPNFPSHNLLTAARA